MPGEPTVRREPCWRHTEAPDFVAFGFARDRLASVQWNFLAG